ncbi:metalloregulator ArsR/SmtB family transcription factor [Brevibacillus brevis]|uniref:Metalloregulator ArsR/SmtB family transcription factor n=1 Tax=Brevibacillus brevis TaxID=1393 RepID=A0ABY9T285_BREBE|nr:metalloregulator ArsR/SmtB family transcription factor [Brevibacillus brevis]WNC14214.1 metalloregulator ArsR/SmtB family transcription factor [Brevibacillus brevis]
MNDGNLEMNQAVKVHRALGEQTRYKIIRILTKESNLCPADLERRLESVALSTLSHHLKQLADSGLLVSQKKGTYIYYSLNEETIKKFAPYLLD